MTVIASSSIAIPTGSWSIDPAHSSIEFGVRHLGIATIKGRATGFTGSITGGEAATIAGAVDVAAITTFDESRDGHLQSPEFFDAERYPQLTFTSTAVRHDGDELLVDGELTIKGISRPVTLRGGVAGPSIDPWGNERIGVTLRGAVDRQAFDLRWNAPLPGGGFLLDDTVTLEAGFSAVRAD